MSFARLDSLLVSVLLATLTTHAFAGDDVGPLVHCLWLVQRHGTAESVTPRNDQKLKGKISKALGKQGVLTAEGVQGLMDTSTFAKLAGDKGQLDSNAVRKCLEADVPESRKLLSPTVAAYADLLTTSFDMIDEPHREAGEKFVDWIVKRDKPGQPLHATVICTGNSRRSILGAMLGNIAAAYYGMPEIRFHSGGTAPSAFNPRTIAALKNIGVKVEMTGREAPAANPRPPTRSLWFAGAWVWKRPSSRRPTSTPAIPRRDLPLSWSVVKQTPLALWSREPPSGSRCPTWTPRSTTTAPTKL